MNELQKINNERRKLLNEIRAEKVKVIKTYNKQNNV